MAWWPDHPTGRYAGSIWFVDEFADELDRRCVAHLDVDHPGATDLVGRVKWMPAPGDLCRVVIADCRAAVDDCTVDPVTATDTLRSLTRTLVRLNFVSEGRFEQDPACDRLSYPRLALVVDLSDRSGDDAQFRLTRLYRARNDAVVRLRRARESVPTDGN